MTVVRLDYRMVREAIRRHLLQLKEVQGLPVHWEGRDFAQPDPEQTKVWLRENIFPEQTMQVASNVEEYLATYQLEILAPIGRSETGEDLVTAIKNHFKPAHSLVAINGSGIHIVRSGPGLVQEQPPWISRPVLINFRTHGLI